MSGVLANKYRPKKFADLVGQQKEMEIAKKIVTSSWRPPALMITGPFGTGKTTTARLLARALLCDHKSDGFEPCGVCDDCLAVEADNHPAYVEVDAASQGGAAEVRSMKDFVTYRTTGTKLKIICYDESHMLSQQAQNALLKSLEEGEEGVLFIFCTTEANRMLATIKSRCIELQMKLLTTEQIASRLTAICDQEGIKADPKALRIISTYVRGHARDAITMLDQLAKMAPEVDEALVRRYLKLDVLVGVYELLCETEPAGVISKLEALLTNLSAAELATQIGEILVSAYKVSVKLEKAFGLDEAWLFKIVTARGSNLLETAEAVLTAPTDHATLTQGVASIGRILIKGQAQPQSTIPKAATAAPMPVAMAGYRKPGK